MLTAIGVIFYLVDKFKFYIFYRDSKVSPVYIKKVLNEILCIGVMLTAI